METAGQPDGSSGRNLADGAADLDLLDQLLSGDGWLDFQDCSDILQTGTPSSMSPFNNLSFSPLFEFSNSSMAPASLERADQDNKEKHPPESTEHAIQSFSSDAIRRIIYTVQSGELSPSTESGTSWLIRRKDPNSSVKERFMQALSYIKDAHKDSDVLVQLWVPVRKGSQLVLTTYSQPFSLNPNCEKLVNYREVSVSYQFSAEKNCGEALGLPGRVFLQRVPEWTPDVRYFSSTEYPRVSYAQRFDVRGSIALPVFEQGSQSCLGVVEVVMTTEKIMYSFELENICNALQAVDLRSSQVLTIPRLLNVSYSYQAVLPEILDVLKAACKLHALPLAQTWVLCVQQGKQGSRHSNENYKDCVSTADDACFVNDSSILGFHEACSEHHLLRGQGVVGQAFTTNQPCYVYDITASSKSDYPLAHHARIFGLKGAVAIRLRSTRTGIIDFVLELFLPMSCTGAKEQKTMLDSLSCSVQSACQTLRVVTTKEVEDESTSSDDLLQKSNFGLNQEQNLKATAGQICDTNMDKDVISYVATTNAASKGKMRGDVELDNNGVRGFCSALQGNHEQETIISAGKIFSDNCHQDLLEDQSDLKDSFANIGRFSCITNEGEKRHKKTEKTISLQILRKYFAGSLKDAAKSLGVCPTTLKRICRHHGITRWPSRKIKKVDHSLKKLQLVIDSVHGADKSIQLPSLYKDFTSPFGSNGNSSGVILDSSLTQKYHKDYTGEQPEAKVNQQHSSSSYSSSACTQKSNSSPSSSVGEQQCPQVVEPQKPEVAMEEILSCIPQGRTELVNMSPTAIEAQSLLNRSQGHRSTGEHYSVDILSSMAITTINWMRVKATYGSDKVRLRLDPTWGFKDFKQEILKRFSIDSVSSMNLKYLDDDLEWVLLTCDADLHECIHIYRSMGTHTIKITLQPVIDR